MYVCLNNESYIRCTNEFGYIAHKNSGKQCVFDSIGSIMLKPLSYIPQEIESIVHSLVDCFEDVSYEELLRDYTQFTEKLQKEGFVVVSCMKNSPSDIPINQITTKNVPPITDLTIELTNRCNEQCVHCFLPNNLKRKGDTLDGRLVKQLIDVFSEMGGRQITFTGGEVLLHNELFDILNYSRQKDLKISIFSNLIALTDKQILHLKDLGIDDIQVSLYGINPQIHDSITKVPGSCFRTIQSLEKLKKAGLPVRIACSVLRENHKDVINVLKYAKSLNVLLDIELNITAREDCSNDNLVHRLAIEEMRFVLEELYNCDSDFCRNMLIKNKETYDKKFNLAEYVNEPLCSAAIDGLYITSNGSYAICPGLQDIKLGSIQKTKLKDIWENNALVNRIRNTTKGDFKKCVGCEASDYCTKCYVSNYTSNGNLMQVPQYLCDMAFLVKDLIEGHNKK